MRANSKLLLLGSALAILLCFGAPSLAQPSPIHISCTTQTMSMLADRINACTLIIESGSNSPEALADAYGNRGVAFLNTYIADHNEDDRKRAVGDLEKSLSLDATSASSHRFHGDLYIGNGDYEAAIPEFSEAIRLDRTQALFFYARGTVYIRKQDYERAIADFNEALRMDSKFFLALYTRGEAYRQIRKLDLAIQDLSDAIGLDPSVAKAFHSRANVYFDKGDFDGAIADYTEAIRLGDRHADVYKFRGESFAAKRDYVHALSDLDTAISLDPKDADAYSRRCRVRFAGQDRGAVLSDCGTASSQAHAQTWQQYNDKASAAVAYRMRYIREQKEREIVKRTGAPRDLATGSCIAIISLDRHGNIRGKVAVSCSDPGLIDEMRQAVGLAAPFIQASGIDTISVRVLAPITQPGVNG